MRELLDQEFKEDQEQPPASAEVDIVLCRLTRQGGDEDDDMMDTDDLTSVVFEIDGESIPLGKITEAHRVYCEMDVLNPVGAVYAGASKEISGHYGYFEYVGGWRNCGRSWFGLLSLVQRSIPEHSFQSTCSCWQAQPSA